MTIRRDIEALAERGLLAKVHGGAIAIEGTTDEPGYAAKAGQQQAEKLAIARAAAVLVNPGTAVGISAGTTTAALARELANVPELTVVTNSVPVADVFYRTGRLDQTVVLTGGTRTPSDALVGPVAQEAAARINLDLLFLGVHGMSARAGYTTPNLSEADTNRALVAAARRLVVLAEHDDAVRDAIDRRDLPPRPVAGELRYDPLVDEWVAIAAHRQTRTFLPATSDCPLCPSTVDRSTEIPAFDYDVVVFENRFPS